MYLLPKDFVVLRVQRDVIFLDILVQTFCAKDFRDFDELVVVVMTVEERLLSEDLGDHQHVPLVRCTQS